MRKYYTRPCNFYYGNYAKKLIKKKLALSLTGNPQIAFDHIEIFQRKAKRSVKQDIYPISNIKKFNNELRSQINVDLKNITSKRKNICGLKFNKTQIMGILNVTPDSFSDGGLFFNEFEAYNQADLMIKDGATIIDIGGESTRPGSKTVNEKEEWKRIENIIFNLKKKFRKIPLSLDTRKSYVMKKGIEKGISIINDVSGLNYDKKSFNLINSKKIPFVLHHMQGTPNTMQSNPKYNDALLDIFDFFEKKINFCLSKKYKKEMIILDPGIGFGKNMKHNITLLRNISLFHSLGYPLLVGTSRKRFIRDISNNNDSKKRYGGTISSCLYLMMQGVQFLRVHDLNEVKQAMKTFKALY